MNRRIEHGPLQPDEVSAAQSYIELTSGDPHGFRRPAQWEKARLIAGADEHLRARWQYPEMVIRCPERSICRRVSPPTIGIAHDRGTRPVPFRGRRAAPSRLQGITPA